MGRARLSRQAYNVWWANLTKFLMGPCSCDLIQSASNFLQELRYSIESMTYLFQLKKTTIFRSTYLNDGALSRSVPARDEVDLVRLEGEVEARVVHEVLQLDAEDLEVKSSTVSHKFSSQILNI